MSLAAHLVQDARIAARPRGRATAIAAVLALVSAELGVRPAALAAPTRGTPGEARARQVAMYLAVVDLELPQAAIARVLGRDRSTVGHAVRRIEDLRDNPEFDAELSRIEAAVSQIAWVAV